MIRLSRGERGFIVIPVRFSLRATWGVDVVFWNRFHTGSLAWPDRFIIRVLGTVALVSLSPLANFQAGSAGAATAAPTSRKEKMASFIVGS